MTIKYALIVIILLSSSLTLASETDYQLAVSYQSWNNSSGSSTSRVIGFKYYDHVIRPGSHVVEESAFLQRVGFLSFSSQLYTSGSARNNFHYASLSDIRALEWLYTSFESPSGYSTADIGLKYGIFFDDNLFSVILNTQNYYDKTGLEYKSVKEESDGSAVNVVFDYYELSSSSGVIGNRWSVLTDYYIDPLTSYGLRYYHATSATSPDYSYLAFKMNVYISPLMNIKLYYNENNIWNVAFTARF